MRRSTCAAAAVAATTTLLSVQPAQAEGLGGSDGVRAFARDSGYAYSPSLPPLLSNRCRATMHRTRTEGTHLTRSPFRSVCVSLTDRSVRDGGIR